MKNSIIKEISIFLIIAILLSASIGTIAHFSDNFTNFSKFKVKGNSQVVDDKKDEVVQQCVELNVDDISTISAVPLARYDNLLNMGGTLTCDANSLVYKFNVPMSITYSTYFMDDSTGIPTEKDKLLKINTKLSCFTFNKIGDVEYYAIILSLDDVIAFANSLNGKVIDDGLYLNDIERNGIKETFNSMSFMDNRIRFTNVKEYNLICNFKENYIGILVSNYIDNSENPTIYNVTELNFTVFCS